MSKFFSFLIIALASLTLSGCINIIQKEYEGESSGTFKTADGKTVEIDFDVRVSLDGEEDWYSNEESLRRFDAEGMIRIYTRVSIDGEEVYYGSERKNFFNNRGFVAKEDQEQYITDLAKNELEKLREVILQDVKNNTDGLGIYSLDYDFNRIFNPAVADTLNIILNNQDVINLNSGGSGGCGSECM